ncbi:MAG: AAA family ATPase [Planctomycetaceae bacterium]|nr:AAA family ATPase [Planctomycetaceae bacterium]
MKRRPFLAVPDTESYFPIPQMEDARLLIERTVRRGEGISLVFGQAGVGKSLLLRMLRKSFDSDFDVVSLASGRLSSAKAFWQNLLHELHLPYVGADEAEMQLALVDHVKNQTSQGLLLLIDESQFLGQIPLDEIRLLLNNDDGASPLFRVVLAGTGEFEEKLTLPQFESFSQRVTTRIYLDPFTRTETFQYITWQISLSKYNEQNTPTQNKTQYQNADNNDEFIDNKSDKIDILRMDFPHSKNSESVFTDIAKDEIFRLTDGSPRQINQLCDAALQLAAQQAVGNIDEILIIAAWGKLQQINVDVEMLNKRVNKVEKTRTENYDEIIARKKNSLQLTEISSHVEYGSLDDDTKNLDVYKEQKSQPAYQVYKPPYPEDDINEFKKFNADDEIVVINDDKIVVVNEELDDESVERLISFELSTSTVESSEVLAGQANNSGEDLPVLLNRPKQIGQPVQRQLFASTFQQFLRKTDSRRFFVCFLPPVTMLPDDANSKVDNLQAICKAYYCYKKSKLKLRENNFTVDNLTGTNSIRLNFTVWHTRIVHSWIGNSSAGSIGIVTRIFMPKPIAHTGFGVEILDRIDTDQNIDPNGAEMNRESLENYGVAVLSGRSPFVRREPVYVYQTNNAAGFTNETNKDQNINVNVDVEVEECSRNIVTKIPESAIAEKNIPMPVFAVDFAEEQPLSNATLACSLKQPEHISNSADSNLQNTLQNTPEFNNEFKENNVECIAETKFVLPEIPQKNWINEDNEDEEFTKIISLWTNPNAISRNIINDQNIDELEEHSEAGNLPVSVVKLPNVRGDCFVGNGEAGPAVEISEIEAGKSVKYGEIVLNWVHEQLDIDHGFGVAYREFAVKSDTVTDTISPTTVNVPMSTDKHNTEQTSFDEHFDETVRIARSAITLDEAYRSVRKIRKDQKISLNTLLEIEQQITDAIRRITRAADKIEFVAEQTERAGQKVDDAADLAKLAGQKIDKTATIVETEIATAIPSYKDLFKQLVEFQKTVTLEVQDLRYGYEDQEYQSENNRDNNENGFLLNQSRPHDLKTYRKVGKRLSKPVSSDKIKLPTAEKRGSEIKTIDINALFQDNNE